MIRKNGKPRNVVGDLGLLFDESAAGIQISGDSGTGKSCVMLLILQSLLHRGLGCCLIDPHGTLARDFELFCAGLPDRIRRKVIVIRPSDPRCIAGINPIGVSTDTDDPVLRRAQIVTKAAHAGRIVLAASGDRDFKNKPTLAKFTSIFLGTLGLAGLTIPEVRHFFDVTSPVYEALSRVAPDFIAQLELEHLAGVRPTEREELIASTKNRFLELLRNPLIELSLGKLEPVLDMRRLIQDGMIVIVNLERGSAALRDEDVEILANLYLSEILFAVYTTPEEERVPFFCFLDELPVFQSSSYLLTSALAQIRKFRLRLVCAHQGTQFFEERTEDRLLNALVGQCGVHLYFRHANPVDAEFFARIIKLPSLDPFRVKHTLKTPQQYQDGHDLVDLFDEGENWSDAEQQGGSEADGSTQTTTHTDNRSRSTTDTTSTHANDTLRDAVSRARSDVNGSSTSRANGTTQTSSNNWSTTHSRGGSRTRRQTLVARMRTRDIVSSVQFLSIDEQEAMAASEQAQLPTGTAIAYVSGKGAAQVAFPLPPDHFRGTPKFAKKKLHQLREIVTARPEFATPHTIAQQRQAFVTQLAAHLHAIADQQYAERRGLPDCSHEGTIHVPEIIEIQPEAKENVPWQI